jgi:hypothetical protein
MMFADLSQAILAAHDNDVIDVLAGNYVDAQTYSAQNIVTAHNVTIEGVGGMVHLSMGPQGILNQKALIVVENGLTLKNFELSGATGDGNDAGIRLEGGNLTVQNSFIHNNDDGILGGVPGTKVVIDHSEFANNGAGDGQTHGIYIGNVDSLTVTNSYLHGASVGHELKSRAAVTTITNNVIADGPTGTASYDIDLPNAGVAVVSNNIIEKGPNAQNEAVVHYGGETQFSYATNSLTVSGNAILNDLGPTSAFAVVNQSNVNGLTVTANLSNNDLFGFASTNVGLGLVNASSNTTLSTEPTVPALQPWTSAPVLSMPTGPEFATLDHSGLTVSGNSNLLTVVDNAGSNTIDGGSGGLHVTETQAWSTINTIAGSQSVIDVVAGTTVISAGDDVINIHGSSSLTASGHSTINLDANAAWSALTLNGNETLNANASTPVTVGASGNVTVNDSVGQLYLQSLGGTAHVNVTAAGGAASADFTGQGSLTTGVGSINITASGNATVTFHSGTDTVTSGGGNTVLQAGSGVDTFKFDATISGHEVINQFNAATDEIGIHLGAGNNSTAASLLAGATVDAQNDLVLHLSAQHDLVLNGIHPGSLSADHIWFF